MLSFDCASFCNALRRRASIVLAFKAISNGVALLATEHTKTFLHSASSFLWQELAVRAENRRNGVNRGRRRRRRWRWSLVKRGVGGFRLLLMFRRRRRRGGSSSRRVMMHR